MLVNDVINYVNEMGSLNKANKSFRVLIECDYAELTSVWEKTVISAPLQL